MLEKTKNIAKQILEEKKANGVLGLMKNQRDIVQPHVFKRLPELDALVLEPKWLLAKLSMSILRSSPEGYRLAVLCRGCDERALIELTKRNQIEKENLLTIGIACSQEQAAICLCDRPYPAKVDAGEIASGVDPFQDERVREFLIGNDKKRMEKWANVLKRCIKCYGCRNSCPICVCEPCKLEDDVWVQRGDVPAEMATFHLIRAFHLSDTCVACGACQEACPVNIPLLYLQLSMRKTLKEKYGYEAGLDPEKKSPILSDFLKEPETGREYPEWINSLREKDGH
ncbi:MAG: 4Fe-4S binding protein [Deltaproteobacteria bacterium]|nr:4Fe-4S binding protein [Deltaproteobacteria bacterium]MBW2651089.1 4Fe-4S binding protein [Deltaproteobacteria bacterium]